MKLFKLKIEIKNQDKVKIINAFGLDFFRQYKDTDFYLESENKLKEKYKEVDGRIILYKINYHEYSALFEIDDEELTDNYEKIDEVKQRKVISKISRNKEVYAWPGNTVRVAFDSIDVNGSHVFCEFYDNDEAKVFKAKQRLVELGFTKFVSKTYDEYLIKNTSLINILIISIIIIVLIIITYFIFY